MEQHKHTIPIIIIIIMIILIIMIMITDKTPEGSDRGGRGPADEPEQLDRHGGGVVQRRGLYLSLYV